MSDTLSRIARLAVLRLPLVAAGLGPAAMILGGTIIAYRRGRQAGDWSSNPPHLFAPTAPITNPAGWEPFGAICQNGFPLDTQIDNTVPTALCAISGFTPDRISAIGSPRPAEIFIAWGRDFGQQPFTLNRLIRQGVGWRRTPTQQAAFPDAMPNIITVPQIEETAPRGRRASPVPHVVRPYPLPEEVTLNRSAQLVRLDRRGRVLDGSPSFSMRASVPTLSRGHDFVEGGRFVASPGRSSPFSGEVTDDVPLVFLVPGIGVLDSDVGTRDVTVRNGLPITMVVPSIVVEEETVVRPIPGIETVPQFAAQLRRGAMARTVARTGFARPDSGKEIKLAFRQASAFASVIKYNLTTEIRDFVSALWDNIPEDCKQFRRKNRLATRQNARRKEFNPRNPLTNKMQKSGGGHRPSLARMAQDVFNHADCINWNPWNESRTNLRKTSTRVIQHRGAFRDLALNEANDRVFGAVGNALKNARARLGYTAGLQFGGGLTNRKLSQEMGVPSPVNYVAELVGF